MGGLLGVRGRGRDVLVRVEGDHHLLLVAVGQVAWVLVGDVPGTLGSGAIDPGIDAIAGVVRI